MYRRAGHYVVAEFGPAGVDIWQEVRTPGGKHSHPLDTTLSHYEMAALCDGWRKFMNERDMPGDEARALVEAIKSKRGK